MNDSPSPANPSAALIKGQDLQDRLNHYLRKDCEQQRFARDQARIVLCGYENDQIVLGVGHQMLVFCAQWYDHPDEGLHMRFGTSVLGDQMALVQEGLLEAGIFYYHRIQDGAVFFMQTLQQELLYHLKIWL